MRVRHVYENIRRRETPRKSSVDRLKLPENALDTGGIHRTEWSSLEGRKADAEYRADVAVAWRAENAFLQATGRFVHEGQHAAIDDLIALDPDHGPHRLGNGSAIARMHHLVHDRIDAALLARLII